VRGTPCVGGLPLLATNLGFAEVVVFPSALHVLGAKESLKCGVEVGVQNFHSASGLGAFTGELVVPQIVDAGLRWVLTGHSERRQVFGETDRIVADKTKAALEGGLNVVLCVGETLEDREAGAFVKVVIDQLEVVAASIPPSVWADRMVIAYEPVWAIGTGKTASVEQAQAMHAEIRSWLASKVGSDAANQCRIVYGGSVKSSNSAGLAAQSDIDGFLVGGASLKTEFLDIIRSTE
jgi:triosephosphate isomerase (TIM)